MRAMFLEFPDFGDNGEEFMFGKDLLVAPAVWEMLPEFEIELPQGKWYDYWTDAQQAGGKTIKRKSTIEEMPVFVREGAIIPQMQVVQSLDEKPSGPIELHVYTPAPGADCSGSLYQDDGLTFAFKASEAGYMRMDFSCAADATGLSFRTKQQGSFKPWWKAAQLVVHGARQPKTVTVGNTALQPAFDAAKSTLTFTVAADDLQNEIRITY